jgi:hypothetical protein
MDPIVLSSANQIIVFIILAIVGIILFANVIQNFWNNVLVKKCPGLGLQEIDILDGMAIFVILEFLRDGAQFTLARRIASTV